MSKGEVVVAPKGELERLKERVLELESRLVLLKSALAEVKALLVGLRKEEGA